jgi:hypothetical protein
VTQEFNLLITPIRANHYLVRTEQVAQGVPLAEEQVQWPVAEWFVQAKQVFDNPLTELIHNNGRLNLGGVNPGGPSLERSTDSEYPQVSQTPPPNLVAFGQTLYDALFQGTIRNSWSIAQGIARHRGEVLRLRLGFKEGGLEGLGQNSSAKEGGMLGHMLSWLNYPIPCLACPGKFSMMAIVP